MYTNILENLDKIDNLKEKCNLPNCLKKKLKPMYSHVH